MNWQAVLSAFDAVESWVAGVSYWVQISLLLGALLPLGWLVAGLIDRIVERILAPHTRREMKYAAAAAIGRRESATPTATDEHRAAS